MDDVRLVANDDGTYAWYCERCQVENRIPRSFLGHVACQCCKRTSFIVEVIR